MLYFHSENDEFKIELCGWKGNQTIRCYVPKVGRAHYLRIVGYDVTEYGMLSSLCLCLFYLSMINVMWSVPREINLFLANILRWSFRKLYSKATNLRCNPKVRKCKLKFNLTGFKNIIWTFFFFLINIFLTHINVLNNAFNIWVQFYEVPYPIDWQ